MKISRFVFPRGTVEDVVADLAAAERDGFEGAWMPQVFGWDPLTTLALAARETSRLRLGTAVVPTHPTHPLLLAASALTTQAATGGRLTLGVGVSHRFIVEGVWGYSYERPFSWAREYLSALLPALDGERPQVQAQRVTAMAPRPLETPGAEPPSVLLAAMGPRMLGLAAEATDGTVTWLVGPRTVEAHVVPTIRAAAAAAGRPQPRVVVGLPVCVTSNPSAARERAAAEFGAYADVPAYRAMLDREGVLSPSEVAIVGEEATVGAELERLAAAGATEFMACVFGDSGERRRTAACLIEWARSPGTAA
jgi:F420-dependent oxidoreductase-like protein